MRYFELIQAALWGKPAVWPAEEEQDLLRMNMQQGTAALVFPYVLEQETLSSYARTHMKGACIGTIQSQIPLQHILRIAWQALEKAGIKAVLMKGAGLAALYPAPHYRSWGDIDLYVGPEQYHPACAVMRETFPKALKFDEELDHYKHYNLIADGVSIEVHRVSVGFQHPLDERRYARMEAYGMTHTEPIMLNGLELRVPEPTFNALFVCLHSWEHMSTQGGNVRQLCDLALLLHHYAGRIDASRLKGYLKALHLTDVWYLYMYILVNQLGLPQEEALFYSPKVAERAERLSEDLLAGRLVTSNEKGQSPKGRFARKWHTMKGRFSNAKRIAQYSPSYARHMNVTTILNGLRRLFAKDRHWE